MASDALDPPEDWRSRLAAIVQLMQEISLHDDPQAMVQAYAQRIQELSPIDRRISLSRRGLEYPHYRITRSTTWSETVNPWQEFERLPQFRGGLLAEFIYGNEPAVIDDLQLPADEPAAEYLADCRSLLAIPMFDQGQALNMVVLLRYAPAAFPKDQIPDLVWRSNLFGRATGNLVLKRELQQAYEAIDHELKIVGQLQRSLLPAELPAIAGLDLAAHYRPSQRAGGDYYDFFPLPDGKWGIFIADVSGHGTPAAVLMAVTHCMAHTHPGPPMPPGRVLAYLNHHLTARYTVDSGAFVTAFYGIYDPAAGSLTYASAGHPPPRLKRCQDGSLLVLDAPEGLPLGIHSEGDYSEACQRLQTGDQIVFYTDGITEAHDPAGGLFGTRRLDALLQQCSLQAAALLNQIIEAVDAFCQGRAPVDDQTVILARVL